MVDSWCARCRWCSHSAGYEVTWCKMDLRQDLKVLPPNLSSKSHVGKVSSRLRDQTELTPSGDLAELSSKPSPKDMLRRVRHCSFTQHGVFRRNGLRCGTFPWSWSWYQRLEMFLLGRKTGKMLTVDASHFLRSPGSQLDAIWWWSDHRCGFPGLKFWDSLLAKWGGPGRQKSATGDWNALDHVYLTIMAMIRCLILMMWIIGTAAKFKLFSGQVYATVWRRLLLSYT